MISLVSLLNILRERCSLQFVNNMIEEIKLCCDVLKKHFQKEFVMSKEDNEDFEKMLQ